MTENHGYNTPLRGATNWDEPLNENFERMDRDVEVRDLDENRSDYTPHDGAKYLAIDTGAVYLGDGSNWKAIGNFATVSSNIYVQDSEPSNPSKNDLWIDTSGLYEE